MKGGSEVLRQVQLLICAVQFLTRVPTPPLRGFQPDWITRSARYFPLVGQGVGAVCAAVWLGGSALWSGWVAAAVAIGAGVLLTGAFHEDGLADTADGLGGGQTPQRRLEIMKDSRIGSYGAAALILTLAAKIGALASLAPAGGAVALIAAHGAARAVGPVVMRLTPYVGSLEIAKWRPASERPTLGEIAVALVLAAWPFLLLPPMAGLAGVAGGLACALPLIVASRRLIGGHTGDVLGGVEQAFELGFLLGVAAVLGAA